MAGTPVTLQELAWIGLWTCRQSRSKSCMRYYLQPSAWAPNTRSWDKHRRIAPWTRSQCKWYYQYWSERAESMKQTQKNSFGIFKWANKLIWWDSMTCLTEPKPRLPSKVRAWRRLTKRFSSMQDWSLGIWSRKTTTMMACSILMGSLHRWESARLAWRMRS